MTERNNREMSGKTCVVTGATSGIGLSTAQALAARGAEVLVVCRNESKANRITAQIEADTGHRPQVYLADLADLAQVRRVGAEIAAAHPKIDVLVNNAGAYFNGREESPQGFERTFAVNHLSYVLLTTLLRPRLESTPAARIVNVASRAHRVAKLDFDDLQWTRRRYRPFVVYGTSKLLNILYTRELARRLEGTDTTVNCLHPGVVRTGIATGGVSLMSIMATLGAPFLLSPEKGAATSIYLATAPDVAHVTGQYFDKCKAIAPKPWARDDAAAARLWEVTEALIAEACPG